MTILNLMGVTPVRPYTNNKAVPLSCPDASLLYGLELEIEGIPGDPSEMLVPGMTGTTDNSLRATDKGVGWEYITKPATFSVVAFILNNFFGKAKFTQEKNYSERCSVHVHANVQDFTPEQLKSLCLLYQVFEKVFYAFAGEDRDKNIFCVPWAETTLTHGIVDRMKEGTIPGLRHWQKYTGLNLIPVTTQGTVEFRQLPGTCDVERILNWLRMIGCLFITAREIPFDKLEKLVIGVNTSSDYRGLTKHVFREWEHLVDIPQLEELLEDGVVNVKYMLLSSAESSIKKRSYTINDVLAGAMAAEARVEMPAFRPAAAQGEEVLGDLMQEFARVPRDPERPVWAADHRVAGLRRRRPA